MLIGLMVQLDKKKEYICYADIAFTYFANKLIINFETRPNSHYLKKTRQ